MLEQREDQNRSCEGQTDELMDDNVIKCDVDLGNSSHYSSKESPSHQSDSGVSEMSDSTSGDDYTPDILDLDSFSFDGNFDQEVDDELAGLFTHVPDSSPKKSDTNVSRQISVEPVKQQKSRTEVLNIAPKQSTSGKFGPTFSRVLRERSQPTLCQEEDIIRLNTPRTSSREPSRIPAIKVVKVVKPPVGSTADDIDHQVFEALDERNKKNAVQAKLNREKKKTYIHTLEKEVDTLQKENSSLKQVNNTVQSERDSLLDEVEYLKSVLANQSALSGLLKNIGNVKNVKLSSSILRKRSAEHDHDYGSVSKKSKISSSAATSGVCLHVDNGSVSLEFCSRCAGMAKGSMET